MAILVKTGNDLAFASIKTRNGLAAASMKNWGGLDTVAPVGGITLLGSAKGNTGAPPSAGTAPMDTTGATFLVAYLAHYVGGGPMTFSDNKGNTWHLLTDYSASAQIAWSNPTSVGAGHTVTGASSGGGYPCMFLAAFTGVNAAPFDQESGAFGSGTSLLQPGSITPAAANSLFILGGQWNDASGNTVDSGFTILQDFPYTPGVSMGGTLAYLIQSGGPTAVNPQWTTGSGGAKTTAMAVFKP